MPSKDLSAYRPTERFSQHAEHYARWRPSYPAEAIDFILDGLNPKALRIADIGAGTGISSRLLAERGAKVIALDPNLEMLEAAEPHEYVRYQQGSAEETSLASNSVDVLTAFQAFHWFVRDTAMQEFKRILKRPGRVAFAWNNRSRDDKFGAAYADLVATFGEEAAIIDRGANVAPPHETLEKHGFTGVTRARFPYEQCLDLNGLIGRARSTSYLPYEGSEYERLLDGLRKLHAQFARSDGYVRFEYRTVVYRGDLR